MENKNYRVARSFTVYAQLHEDFVKMCNNNGVTASQMVANFEYMYVTNHALIQQVCSQMDFSKGAKNYGY